VDVTRDRLVDASTLVPGLVLDLRYATANNPFKRQLYEAPVFALRRSVALRLAQVARGLESAGMRLLAFDGYRPLSVQRLLWELCPVVGFVAPPERGSNHNRGTAVDVSLADPGGAPVEMPCDFDEFSQRAHHEYAGASEAARRHRALLRAAMEARGFSANRMEWWHYDAPDAKAWPVEDIPLSALKGVVADP
jgi:zinc D-Ala-D-Ala dipeptidase